jgi:hypothetical protein
LLEKASKAARWLGYIDFEQITDERNAEPVVRIRETRAPLAPFVSARLAGLSELPREAAAVAPFPVASAFYDVEQPNRIALIGEKSSLRDVLDPVSERYGTDLYLPTGCISNTHLYRLAKTADEDGRPLVVLQFADCDPAGWNMAVEVARKLQAFTVTHFPELVFEVHRAALTIGQVRDLGLPSSPLKAEEKRADRWRAAFGVEQTEIDALATLRPRVLTRIAEDALARFYDTTLNRRVSEAHRGWQQQAQAVIDQRIDGDWLTQLHDDVQTRLDDLHTEIDRVNQDLDDAITGIELPDVDVPEPEFTQGSAPPPLIDSSWSFIDQTAALKRSKSYGGG